MGEFAHTGGGLARKLAGRLSLPSMSGSTVALMGRCTCLLRDKSFEMIPSCSIGYGVSVGSSLSDSMKFCILVEWWGDGYAET
jgi:hypothetical protein